MVGNNSPRASFTCFLTALVFLVRAEASGELQRYEGL